MGDLLFAWIVSVVWYRAVVVRASGLLGIRTAVKDANIAKHNAIMNAIARIVIVF